MAAGNRQNTEAVKYLVESAHCNKEATDKVSIMRIIDALTNSESLMIIVHSTDVRLISG